MSAGVLWTPASAAAASAAAVPVTWGQVHNRHMPGCLAAVARCSLCMLPLPLPLTLTLTLTAVQVALLRLLAPPLADQALGLQGRALPQARELG